MQEISNLGASARAQKICKDIIGFVAAYTRNTGSPPKRIVIHFQQHQALSKEAGTDELGHRGIPVIDQAHE